MTHGTKGFQNLKGLRFGRLIVIKKVYKPEGGKGTGAWWLCRCDCGAEKTVVADNLRKGYTKSCGCLRRETSVQNLRNRMVKKDVHTLQP